MLNEDLFNMIAGSGALRGIYDTGIVFFREDEKYPNNVTMKFEIRKSLPGDQPIEKINLLRENWEFVRSTTGTTAAAATPNKELDLQNKIVKLIKQEAKEGRFYTMGGLGRTFANTEGFPSDKTIRRSLDKLAAQQTINFFNNPESYGFEESYKIGSMFVCIPNMDFQIGGNRGVIKHTHYKCPQEDIIKIIKN